MIKEWIEEFKKQISNFSINWNAVKGISLMVFTMVIFIVAFGVCVGFIPGVWFFFATIILAVLFMFSYNTSVEIAIRYIQKKID